ncbi:MAG: VWA domain-containing protein [Vicinamibacterales bacterium]
MTFGLLTAGQLALVAGLTAAAVLVIFFLKIRHPRMEVPSLVLWQRVLDDERRDSLIEKLRRVLSLLLALAIALLLAFALSEPQRAGAAEGRVALVIDNSATMAARAEGGGTRLEHAIAEARAIVDGAPGARFQVADTAGTVLSPPGLDRPAARDALLRVVPRFTAPRLPALAEGYTPTVITDGVSLDLPEDMARVMVPAAGGNVGITAFEVRQVPSHPDEFQAYLAIVNFDQAPREATITIGAPGRASARRTVQLAPGSRLNDVLPMRDLAPGPIEVRLEQQTDAFALDDVAYGWLPERRAVRVGLVTAGDPELAAALAANPRVAASRIAPEAYGPGVDADVLVFDGFTPEAAPDRPAIFFGADSRPWLESAPVDVPDGMALATAPHPITGQLSLADVHARRVRAFSGTGMTSLARLGGRTVVASGRATRPWVAVGFPLATSNFSSQPAFPIFLGNAVAWLGDEPAPLTARLGLVHVPTAGATVVDPEGRPVTAIDAGDETVFLAGRPGIYFAEHDGGRQAIAVNLSDQRASALTPTRRGNPGDDAAPASAAPDSATPDSAARAASARSPLWVTLAALAFFLLVLEWWTWQRRITI